MHTGAMDSTAGPRAQGALALDGSLVQTVVGLSCVQLHGEHAGSCGYCKKPSRGKTTYGMTAARLTCTDYQALCDAGWRRSGTYLYKPSPNICCPQHTIRLDVTKFKASSHQRRIVRRFNEFLRGERDLLNEAPDNDSDNDAAEGTKSRVQQAGRRRSEAPGTPLQRAAASLSQRITDVVRSVYGESVAGALKSPLVVPYRAPAAHGHHGHKAGAVPGATASAGMVATAGSSTNDVPLLCSAVAMQLHALLKKAHGQQQGSQAGQASAPEQAGTGPAMPVPSPQHIATGLADRLSAVLREAPEAASYPVVVTAAATGHVNFCFPRGEWRAFVSGEVLQLLADSTGTNTNSSSSAVAAGAGGTAAVSDAQSSPSVGPPKKSRRTDTEAGQDGVGHAGHGGLGGHGSGAHSGNGAAGSTTAPAPAPRYPTHTFRVDMVPAAFHKESWELWKRYQAAVHGDPPSKLSKEHYTDFLCTNPLVREPHGASLGGRLGTLLKPHEASGSSSSSDAVGASSAELSPVDLELPSKLAGLTGLPQAVCYDALLRARGDVNVALPRLLEEKEAIKAGLAGPYASTEATGAATSAGAAGPASSSPEAGLATFQGQLLDRAATGARKAWIEGEGSGAGVPLTHSHSSGSTAAGAGAGSSAVAGPTATVTGTATATAVRLHPSVITGFGPAVVNTPAFKQGQGQGHKKGKTRDQVDGGESEARVAGSKTQPQPQPRPSDIIFPDMLDTAASGTALDQGYGAFHQRYYLDNKLIAVAVIDILPQCLSSVYVFYEPSLAQQLQLGKLTALREIQWVQAAHAAASPRLKYYYMGYFIVSCPKMRYKGDYAPSDIRCPVTGAWVPLSVAFPVLDTADQPAASAGTAGAGKGGKGASPSTGASDATATSASAGSAPAAPSKPYVKGEALVESTALQAWTGSKRLRDASLAAAVSRIPLMVSHFRSPRPPAGSAAAGGRKAGSGPGSGASAASLVADGSVPSPEELCSLRELDDRAKKMLQPMLLQWLALVGPELGTRMLVQL